MGILIDCSTGDMLRTGDRDPQAHIVHDKPVIKLSLNGMLLHANEAGIGFLEQLSISVRSSAVNYLIRNQPAILDLSGCPDFDVHLENAICRFTVVAFQEAGYVGLYGVREAAECNTGSKSSNG